MDICDSFEDIRSHLVIRVALWILGEYATSQKDVDNAFETIKKNIGPLPLFALDYGTPDSAKEESKDSNAGPTTTIEVYNNFPLRKALINTEDDYVSSCLAMTLTKLAVKAKKNLS